MTSPATPVDQLVGLGIPKPKAIYALGEFENNAEVAADWCFTEGADWTPNDLLRTSHARPPSDPSPSAAALQDDERSSRTHRRSTRRAGDVPTTPPGWTPVPSRLVDRGTRVAITLKQDQGTDRTVRGVVAEKLSRGDHPRGIKVRLKDGQVGRIVRILDVNEAA